MRRFRLDLVALNRTPATRRFYDFTLDNFTWWVLDQGLPPHPVDLTPADFVAFFVYVRDTPARWGSARPTAGRPVQTATVLAYWRALHAFFAYLVLEGTLASNPLDAPLCRRFRASLLRLPRSRGRAYTDDEVERLIGQCARNTARGARNEAMIRVLLVTGMRASELCRLRLRDYDREHATLHVRGAKHSGERDVPLLGLPARAALHWWLDNYRPTYGGDDGAALFLGLRAGAPAPLTPVGLTAILRQIGEQAGIEKVRAHWFRNTCAVNWLKAGREPRLLQLMLGHTTFEMTAHYLTWLEEEKLALLREAAPEATLNEAAIARHRQAAGHLPAPPAPPRPRVTCCPVCAAAGQVRPVVARDLCGAHLKRWERFGDVRADVPLGGRCLPVEAAPLPADLVTVEAAAGQVGLTPKGVRTAVERGNLPATKINGRWAIDPTALEAWNAKRRRKDGG